MIQTLKPEHKIVPDYPSANIFISAVNPTPFAVLLCKSLASIKALRMSSREPVCLVFTNPFSSFLTFLFACTRAAGVLDLKRSAGLRKSKLCSPLSADILCDLREII